MSSNWSELVGLADGRVFVITQVDERDGWATSTPSPGPRRLTRLAGDDPSLLAEYVRLRSEVRRMAEELGWDQYGLQQMMDLMAERGNGNQQPVQPLRRQAA